MEYKIRKALYNIKKHRTQLTPQQFKTIQGQIIAGEPAAAMKGLWRLIERSRNEQIHQSPDGSIPGSQK